MSPDEFYRNVLAPNVEALKQHPGDIRLAVNALMTCDAFFGIFAATTGKTDKAVKDALADDNHAWRLARDTAYSFKHGELTSKARLVVSPSAVVKDGLRWTDMGTWNAEVTWEETAGPFVLIEHSSARLRADLIAIHVMALADDLLNSRPSPPISLSYLQSQGVFS